MIEHLYIGGIALIVGMILLIIHHCLKKSRDKAVMQCISHNIIWKVKKAMIDATEECMDILPEKIMEAKKTIEGE